jgi:hypothetical protein
MAINLTTLFTRWGKMIFAVTTFDTARATTGRVRRCKHSAGPSSGTGFCSLHNIKQLALPDGIGFPKPASSSKPCVTVGFQAAWRHWWHVVAFVE